MNLLAPLALLGLIAIPVIILLHLLRTRRRPMLISNLNLWLGLQQKKQAVMPRYIPFTLLLLLQLCVAGGLALALARPALSFLVRQPQHTTLILDTTTSMVAQDAGASGQTTRFDEARSIAQSHLQDMTEKDTFALISLNRYPEVLLAGDSQGVPAALTELDALLPGGAGLDLPAALTLANGLVDPDRQNQIIVLTDGNYKVEAGELPLMKVPLTWHFIPPQNSTENQALLNVSAQTWPDGRHRLFARLINYAETAANRTLRLSVNDEPAQEISVDLGPGAESARAWTLPDSAETVTVEIVEPDALLPDNRAELFLTAPSQYQVLLVSDAPEPESSALAKALEAQGVQLTIESPDYWDNNISDNNLIVFDGWLPQDWPTGNILLVNPPLNKDDEAEQKLLRVEDIEANRLRPVEPITPTIESTIVDIELSGVFFEQVPYVTPIDWNNKNIDLESTILLTKTRTHTDTQLTSPQVNQESESTNSDEEDIEYPSLIIRGNKGDSQIVIWAFNLDEGNLAGRPALPLLIANTLSTFQFSASDSKVFPVGEPILIGDNFTIETPAGRRLMMPSGSANGLSAFTRTQEPGLYRVYNQEGRLAGGFGLHAGSALESNLTAQFTPESLVEVNPAATVEPDPVYYEFWPWLAGLAVILVTIEGWLAWRK